MEQIDTTLAYASEEPENISWVFQPTHKLMRHSLLAKDLPNPIKVVQTAQEEQELYELWVEAYKDIYPDYEVRRHDPQNSQAHILYSRNQSGKVTSSIRLTIDSPLGMPSGEYYPPEVDRYRKNGNKLMEFGRLVSNEGSLQLLRFYYQSIYLVAKAENIDVVVMVLKQKDVPFHQRLLGAHTLLEDVGMPVGGEHKMSCAVWEIKQTKPYFFKWVGLTTNRQERGIRI
jgi:hypothetical protein